MNSEMVFCPRCGAVTTPGTCTNCGYKIEEVYHLSTEEENTDETNSEETQKSKSSHGWIIGLIVGICLFAFLFIFAALLLIVGFAPIIVKEYYASVNPSPVQPTVSPLIPSMDEDDEDEDEDDDEDTDENDEDDDDTDEDDDDDDSSDPSDWYDGFSYSQAIEGNPSSAGDFDEDKFNELIEENANEFTDEPNENDYFTNGLYYGYTRSGASHDFIERDGFYTPYYQNIVNSYIENENYDVQRNVIRYEGQTDGVYINAYCAYYSLSSDTVDYTDINEALREQSLCELYRLLSAKSYPDDTYSYTMYSDSVITFNNDEILSVAYDTTVYRDSYIDNFYIHGINADVKNGILMDNTKILNMDDSFSQFFVQRSNTQNSYVEAINECTTQELTAVLNNDDALILYFTPLGIEVGLNYSYFYDGGWVTVTINDFDSYLSGEYSFNTDFGKGYDIYQYEKDNGIVPKDGYEYDWDIDYEDL
ncbi:MAG: hypothetical protein J5840_04425 [Lachnospiraceae bacterium]|nr:hypothetical protein [Lachnospiraceae bacterium]